MSRIMPLVRHTGWMAAFFLHLGLALTACTLYLIAINVNFSAFGFVGMLTGEKVIISWAGGAWPQLMIHGGWADAINFLRIAGVAITILVTFFWITPKRGTAQSGETMVHIEVPPIAEALAIGAMLYDVTSTWWALSNGVILDTTHYDLVGAVVRAGGILLFSMGLLSFGATIACTIGLELVVLHWTEGWELTGMVLGQVFGALFGAVVASVTWGWDRLNNARGMNASVDPRSGPAANQPAEPARYSEPGWGQSNWPRSGTGSGNGYGNNSRPGETVGRSPARPAPLPAPVPAGRGAGLAAARPPQSSTRDAGRLPVTAPPPRGFSPQFIEADDEDD